MPPAYFNIVDIAIGLRPPTSCPVISAPALPGNKDCAVAAPVPAATAIPASLLKKSNGFAAPFARGAAIGADIPTSSAIRPIRAVDALVLSYSVLIPKLLSISVV